MTNFVLVKILSRDHALVVDSIGIGAGGLRRVEHRDRPVGRSHKAVQNGSGVLILSHDRTAAIDSVGVCCSRSARVEGRDRSVSSAHIAVKKSGMSRYSPEIAPLLLIETT